MVVSVQFSSKVWGVRTWKQLSKCPTHSFFLGSDSKWPSQTLRKYFRKAVRISCNWNFLKIATFIVNAFLQCKTFGHAYYRSRIGYYISSPTFRCAHFCSGHLLAEIFLLLTIATYKYLCFTLKYIYTVCESLKLYMTSYFFHEKRRTQRIFLSYLTSYKSFLFRPRIQRRKWIWYHNKTSCNLLMPMTIVMVKCDWAGIQN